MREEHQSPIMNSKGDDSKPNSGGAGGGSKRRCRYGADCRNIDRGCKFHHPSASSPAGAAAGASASNDATTTKKKSNAKEKKSNNKQRDKSKIQCRYGMECRNTKCPFFHHPAAAAVPVSPQPTGTVKVVVSSPNTTSFADALSGKSPHKNKSSTLGNHAMKDDIPHATPEQNSSPLPKSNGNGAVVHTIPSSRKATTKKKCRWGSGCRNKKCSFLHPGQQLDPDYKKQAHVAGTITAGGSLKPICTVVPPKAVPPDPKETASTRSVGVHSILPPQEESQKQPDSIQSTFYPPGLHFPSTSSHSGFTTPFQAPSTQTTEALSNFGNIFSTVSNAPASGFPEEGDHGEQRTPLYSKSRNAQSLMTAGQNCNDVVVQGFQSTGEAALVKESHPHAAIPSQEEPPDADWLFEVLGLNDADVNDKAVSSQQTHCASESVAEKPFVNVNSMADNITANGASSDNFNHALPNKNIRPASNPSIGASASMNLSNNTAVEKQSKKELVPEEELVQSRRAALELRFESQQSTNDNHELLTTLLQTCRSKQDMIRNALEQSMGADMDTEQELDEADIVSLLELNELLCSSISMAESSLRMSSKSRGGETQKAAVKKCSAPKISQRVKDEDNSSWKPVDRKASSSTSTKAATKKIKPIESPAKTTKSGRKKPAKLPNAETQKQDEKPTASMPPSESHSDNPVSNPETDAVDVAQQEKERMARLLEEARKQAAAARERKKSKKNKKFERFLKQNEEARENRVKSWSERIARENDYVDLIRKLLVAEFLRQSKNKAMGLTGERVLSDSISSEVLSTECREAYHVIFEGVKCRVVIAGSENKDMNGRQGTVRYWDREKEKFSVGLDTKKSSDSEVQYLTPEILDMLPLSRALKTDKRSSMTSYHVEITDFINYGGVSLGFSFILQKSHVIALGSAESTKIGLEIFCKTREREEHQRKVEEEAEKKREEDDRKRRAARRAQEDRAWEQRKSQARRDKEEYEQMKKEMRGRGRSMFDFDEDDEDCQCPRCRLGDRFFNSGGSFFFNIGGIPFRVRFGSDDSDEESFFDDEFDDRWEEQLAEEKEEENRKQAGILGVDSDDDERTIKLAYRKMALQYHPDKWKHNSEHGMSRREAENRFKSIQSAYDHLMSNFDD